jgi:hypothetical protein
MIDFDDMGGGFVDEDYRAPDDLPPLGLVVAERAQSGAELRDEEKLLRYVFRDLPLVIFEEDDEDDPTQSHFTNAAAYRRAMGTVSLPTEAEALAWQRQVIADRIAAWESRKR